MKTNTYRVTGAVTTGATLEVGETPMHFRFEVRAFTFQEAQDKSDEILDGSFNDNMDYSELLIEEI